MKRILLFAALLAVLTGCSKGTVRDVVSLEFIGSDLEMEVGENRQLSLKISYDDGSQLFHSFKDASVDVSLKSDDESIASVSGTGIVSALSVGTAVINASLGGKTAQISILVKIPEGGIPLPDPKKHVSDKVIYLNVNNSYGMQVFEMLDDGSIILSVSWGDVQDQYFERIYKDGRRLTPMHMSCGDHGDSMSVEETGGKIYLWFSCFCDKFYDGPQLLVRTEFRPGENFKPEDFTDLFYYGNAGQGYVSVDDKHDLLSVFQNNHVDIFSLKDALNAPLKEVSLTRYESAGGVRFTRKAHDLTSLKRISSLDLKNEDWRGTYMGENRARQGYCVYKDHLYFHVGVKDVAVSVVDFYGNYKMKHVEMAVDDDKDALINAGLLDPNYNFEPEGIQIQNGKVYLGFTPFWNKILVLEM